MQHVDGAMAYNGAIYYVGFAILLSTLICLAVATIIVFQSRTARKSTLAIEEARFEFRKRISYINARLERDVADWQRKASFAEQALTDFYVAEGLLAEIRESPPHRTRSFSEYRTVKALLDKHRDTVSNVQMKRHLAQALFGVEGGAAYQQLLDIFRDLRFSTTYLADAAFADDAVEPHLRAHHEAMIWATTPDDDDPMKLRFAEATRSAEEVFGVVLRPRQ